MTDACERTQQREREREREKENGQRREREKIFAGKKKVKRARENKKERLFSSHLRRFCTRRWLLFGTARLPRRPCSSVRLSICPSFFFPFLYEAIFLLLEVERSSREKNPKPYYAFYSNPLGKLYTTTTSKKIHTRTHIYIKSSHLSTRVKLKNAQS